MAEQNREVTASGLRTEVAKCSSRSRPTCCCRRQSFAQPTTYDPVLASQVRDSGSSELRHSGPLTCNSKPSDLVLLVEPILLPLHACNACDTCRQRATAMPNNRRR